MVMSPIEVRSMHYAIELRGFQSHELTRFSQTDIEGGFRHAGLAVAGNFRTGQ